MVKSGLVNGKDSDSISGTSSQLEGSTKEKVLVEEVFSRIRSRRASPSEVVLHMNDPPAVISSCWADSLLSPT